MSPPANELSQILDACSAPIFVKDPHGRFVTINSAAAALLGRSVDELIGRTDAELFPERMSAARAQDEQVLRTGEPFSVEEHLELPNGESRVILVRKTRAISSGGGPLLVAWLTDQTDLRRSRLAVAKAIHEKDRSSLVLRGVLDSTDQAVFSIDREYRYTSFNAAHAAVMRALYDVEIELGVLLSEAQRVPEDWAIARLNLDRALAGESFTDEASSGSEARTRRFFEVTHHPIRDAAGLVIGAAVFARDTTERHRTTAELRASEARFLQAQKMESVGRLAGGVAHDFNNLLTVILSSVTLLLDSELRSGPRWEELDAIRAAGERACDLTRQLLAFSRQQVLTPAVLDLNVRARELERLLQRIIGEDVVLTLDLQSSLGLVSADPNQLGQVLMNLVVNSRDAMPRGGAITIRTRTAVSYDGRLVPPRADTASTHVALSVIDTGVGMTPEVAAKIFEPFFTTKERSKGTGLGLSTVYGIVEQSGGSLEVQSEPGRGSTFTIYLPIVTGELAQLPRHEPRRTPLARPGETVLVVEDDVQVRAAATRALRDLGYEVLGAGGLAEAVSLARGAQSRLGLVLTDVVMPDADGVEVVAAVEQTVPGVAAVYCSGFPDEVLTTRGLALSASNFLSKPFTPDSLGRKVREALDAARGA